MFYLRLYFPPLVGSFLVILVVSLSIHRNPHIRPGAKHGSGKTASYNIWCVTDAWAVPLNGLSVELHSTVPLTRAVGGLIKSDQLDGWTFVYCLLDVA